MESSVSLAKNPETFDYITRICGSPHVDSHYNVDVQVFTNTEEFVYNSGKLHRENQISRGVIKRLWKLHQYDQEYKSFLLGTYTKEEFREIAKNYAEPAQQHPVNIDKLKFAANYLFTTIKQPLTSFDISLMLNIDCSSISENLIQMNLLSDTDEKE